MNIGQRLAGVGLLITVFVTVFISSAAMGLSQDGRISDSNNVDGASVQIDGATFNPANPSCVVYSLLVYDSTTPRMVELGLLRCNNAVADEGSGSCTGGHSVAERFNGVGYNCVQGNTFSDGQYYTATIQRNASTSTQMDGSIHGAPISQGGFGGTDTIKTYTWAESTGACPTGGHLANFYQWKRKLNGSWGIVSGPNIYHGYTQCWNVGDYNASTGGYDVH